MEIGDPEADLAMDEPIATSSMDSKSTTANALLANKEKTRAELKSLAEGGGFSWSDILDPEGWGLNRIVWTILILGGGTLTGVTFGGHQDSVGMDYTCGFAFLGAGAFGMMSVWNYYTSLRMMQSIHDLFDLLSSYQKESGTYIALNDRVTEEITELEESKQAIREQEKKLAGVAKKFGGISKGFKNVLAETMENLKEAEAITQKSVKACEKCSEIIEQEFKSDARMAENCCSELILAMLSSHFPQKEEWNKSDFDKIISLLKQFQLEILTKGMAEVMQEKNLHPEYPSGKSTIRTFKLQNVLQDWVQALSKESMKHSIDKIHAEKEKLLQRYEAMKKELKM